MRIALYLLIVTMIGFVTFLTLFTYQFLTKNTHCVNNKNNIDAKQSVCTSKACIKSGKNCKNENANILYLFNILSILIKHKSSHNFRKHRSKCRSM